MQTVSSIEEVVGEVLVEILDLGDETLNSETNLRDDLGADSIDLVEIALELEDRYDTEIPDDELETATTVADLCKIVRRYVKV